MHTIEDVYHRFVEKRFPLPTEEQVAELEQQLGVELPADYRQFILKYNGGYFIEPDIIPVVDGYPKDCLTVLYGIGASHASAELSDPGLTAIFDDNDPPQILPIGYTLMGNLILLITQGDEDERGSIVLKVAYSDDAYLLSDGIEDFLKLLREPTDDEK